jgi:hypothetical protein
MISSSHHLQLDDATDFHSWALIRDAQKCTIRICWRPGGTPHFSEQI